MHLIIIIIIIVIIIIIIIAIRPFGHSTPALQTDRQTGQNNCPIA